MSEKINTNDIRELYSQTSHGDWNLHVDTSFEGIAEFSNPNDALFFRKIHSEILALMDELDMYRQRDTVMEPEDSLDPYEEGHLFKSCPVCKAIMDGDRFCPYCGQRIGE